MYIRYIFPERLALNWRKMLKIIDDEQIKIDLSVSSFLTGFFFKLIYSVSAENLQSAGYIRLYKDAK